MKNGTLSKLNDLFLDVVVLSYNSEKYLRECVQSCIDQSYPFNKIIVIDNASKDGSKEILNDFADNSLVEIAFEKENLGFTGGMNKGIALSHSHWVLCLNSDMKLHDRYNEEMVDEIKRYSQIGCVCGKVYRWDEPEKIDAVGNELNYRFTLKNNGKTEQTAIVFGANGCAPFYKREALEEIKVEGDYFDNRYFAFMEDTDMAWRLFLSGWKTLFVPKSIAWHKRSASFDGKVGFFEKPKETRRRILLNRYRTLLKNFNYLSLFLLAPYLILSEVLVWGFLIFKSKEYLNIFIDIIHKLLAEKEYIKKWRVEIRKRKKRAYLSILAHIR